MDKTCNYCDAPAIDEVCDINRMPEGVRVWVPVCKAHEGRPFETQLSGEVSAFMVEVRVTMDSEAYLDGDVDLAPLLREALTLLARQQAEIDAL